MLPENCLKRESAETRYLETEEFLFPYDPTVDDLPYSEKEELARKWLGSHGIEAGDTVWIRRTYKSDRWIERNPTGLVLVNTTHL